jgi:Flp pilus assembly protein TadD
VADFHYHLGLALQGLGRSAEARQAFDEALRIEPGHRAAQQARSQVPPGADAS